MPCYKPLLGWRSDIRNEDTGKYPVVFSKKPSQDLEEIILPCGRCIGCRLEYSRQWAMRIMYEASEHTQNTFITLTYDPEFLPKDQSLEKAEWQKFLKKFRQFVFPHKIRFFACGEYGQDQELLKVGIDSLGRPHYHAVIFGYQFPDIVPFEQNAQGDIVYTSEILARIWGKGFVTVGEVTFESAAYVARYVVKKVTGDAAFERYEYIDYETGETYLRLPEFCLMSRRPGVGKGFFDKYKTDFHKGFITVKGIKMQPPKYYDKLFESVDPFTFEEIKALRVEKALDREEGSEAEWLDRLSVKEKIKTKKLKTLKRNL